MAARPVVQAMASILPELTKNVNPNLVKNVATTTGTVAVAAALSGGKTGGNKSGSGCDDGEEGNDNIHAIVRQSGRSYKVRIDLEDYKGFPAYAAYSDFYVDSEETNYTLYLGQYSGNAGDAMMDVDQDSLSGMRFSTWDRDNDESHFHCSYRKGLMTVHVLTAMDFILDILTFLDIRIGVYIGKHGSKIMH